MRGLVSGQDWLSWLQPHVVGAPDWVLVIPAPIFAIVVAAWTLGRAKRSSEEVIDTLRTGASMLTGGVIPDKPKAANVDHVRALEEKLQQLTASQAAQAEALIAQLEAMNQRLAAAGVTVAIGAEERTRRNEAIAETVAEETPGAKAFEQNLLESDELNLDALKVEAREAETEAAAKWRRIAALARGVNDGEALEAYEQAFKLQPEDFWTCIELARLRQRYRGDLAGAAAAAEAAKNVAQGDLEKGLAYEVVANIALESGSLSLARTAVESALEAREKLAQSGDAIALGNFSVSLGQFGIIAMQEGDLAGARDLFAEALKINEHVAEALPGADAERDVWVALSQLADAHWRCGDFTDAENCFGRGLAMAQQHAADGATEIQRDVHMMTRGLGNALFAQNKIEASATQFKAALEMSEALAAKDPDNAEAQRDVMMNLTRLGDLGMRAQDISSARAYYERGLAMSEQLAENNPESALALKDALLSSLKLGQVVKTEGDAEQFLAHAEGCVELAERLAQLDPANFESQRDVSLALELAGDARRAQGDIDGAISVWRRKLTIDQALIAFAPDDPATLKNEWVGMWRLASAKADGVTWADVAARLETLHASGLLLEADVGFLEKAKAAAAESGDTPSA